MGSRSTAILRSKEKQSRRDRAGFGRRLAVYDRALAAGGRMVAQTLGDCRDRSDLDGKSEVLQAGNEAMDLLALAAFVEVMRAEVVIEGSGLQHLIDGSEDRGSDSADRLFSAAAGA